MVQTALSPSQLTQSPRSLAERIAAEIPEQPPAPEPTVSSMAERFAPEPPKPQTEGPRRPMLEVPMPPPHKLQIPRSAAANRWLLVALFVLSLVPAATLLALLWYGGVKLGDEATVAKSERQPVASQQASLIAVPTASVPAKAEPKPDIALTTPAALEAAPGDDVAFPIAIDSTDALPAQSLIAIRAMPQGAAFSQGRPDSAGGWSLRPDEIGELRLLLPEAQAGEAELRIEFVAADGGILASAVTRLAVAADPDPKSGLILRANESDRAADLIGHGEAMIDVGYFAGARAYFRRAAETGSGEAALALGATYDPAFIEALAPQGIKPEPNAAAEWYERAKELGVEDQEAKLAALKEDWTRPPQAEQQTQTAAAEPARLAPAAAKPSEPKAEPPSSKSTLGRLMQAAGIGGEEWVVISGAVNLRAEPSSTGQTLRVVEKGMKLRATDRKGNWVRVTDPTTSEEGWVYSRFLASADSPAR